MLDENNVDNITDVIIDEFNEHIYYMSKSYVTKLLNCHGNNIDYDFDIDDFVQGFVFAYQEDGVIFNIFARRNI